MNGDASISYRPWQAEDIHYLLRWENDPELWAMEEASPYQRLLEDDLHDWFDIHCVDNRRALLISCDDAVIGCIGLRRISAGQADFYIMIGEKSYWHHGIGTEAMRRLEELAQDNPDVRLLAGQVLKTNTAALGFYDKLGYLVRPDSDCNDSDYLVIEKQIIRTT